LRFTLGLLLIWVSVGAASAECVTLRSDTQLSLAGTLTYVVFPGPPNYESIENGDSPEPTYILAMRSQMCIEDGGQFADPANRFDSVQLFTTDESLWVEIKKLEGKQVHVSGLGFAAHTGHHHAPLILKVESITPGDG